MPELSEAVNAICKTHYDFKVRTSCNQCPLQPECYRSGDTLTQASLDDWRERLNRLAAQHGERREEQQELPL